MMDRLAIEAAEAAVHPNFPPTDTVLIVELDGPAAEVHETSRSSKRSVGRPAPCRLKSRAPMSSVSASGGAARRRLRRWAGSRPTTTCRTASCRGRSFRKSWAGSVPSAIALGCGSPTSSTPATATCTRSSATTSVCLDRRRWPRKWPARFSTYCIEAGGSLTGEHGVGADKKDYMPRMFSDDDLMVMQQVRDAIDPARLCNPGKVLPTPRLCGEVPGPYRQHPVEAAGLADRF